MTKDGLVNVASGLGTAKSKRTHNVWQLSALNQYKQLDAAFQDSWLARQIVEIPAEDMTREWRRINSDGAVDIESYERAISMKDMVRQAETWARLYGGAAIVMITDQPLDQPLNVEAIKEGDLKRLIVFDRWELGASDLNATDVTAANFLLPDSYIIQGGTTRVHHSHVARFSGDTLPRRLSRQTSGWGDSVLRKCLSDLGDIVSAHEGVAELMSEANVDVIKREGLSEDLSTDQDDAMIKRFELFSLMKSTVQLALLDSTETYERKELSFTGTADVLDRFAIWLSGASRIPMTKLFGTSSKGFNATGEGDLKTYYDDIKALQESKLGNPLQAIDQVLVRSSLGYMPDNYNYEWNPLSQPNQLESAQANQLRAQTDMAYLDSGVVQRSQIQRELQSKDVYQFDDDKIAELEQLEDPNMFDERVGGQDA